MVIGIYLAAGESKRMGCQKLLLPIGGMPLGSFALKTALQSSLDKVLVVTTSEDCLHWFIPQFFEPRYREKWVRVTCSKKGQSESLKCGLKVAMKLSAKAVMIILADQPFITTKLINALIETKTHNYVSSCYNGIARPPVLFKSVMFNELLKLKGDEGARKIIRDELNRGLQTEFYDKNMFLDVDTPEQYEQINNSVCLDAFFSVE